MQQTGARTQSPQRWCLHFTCACGLLRDAISKRTHVMQQQVRIQRHSFAVLACGTRCNQFVQTPLRLR